MIPETLVSAADPQMPHLTCSPIAPIVEAVRLDPAWQTSTVLALAQGIIRDGTFDVMPILADALEDAGCDNAILLEHCRHGTQHTKACWVLPLILTSQPSPVAPPPKERSLFAEAAEMIRQRDYTLGDQAVFVVLLSLWLGFLLLTVTLIELQASGLDFGFSKRMNLPTFALLLVVFPVGTTIAIVYLVLCCKAIRNRWRRRRAQQSQGDSQ